MSWRAAFAGQARACAGLGSPFTARLLQGFADRGLPEGAVERRIADWPGDISASGASVPLRLAGALHGLVLERRDAALAAVYPPAEGDELALWRAASSAILAQEDWVLSRLETAPQTNEVARSAALIVAARWLAGQTGLPMVLSELGASAGLNLIFDRYALQTPERWLGPAEANVVLAPEWRGQRRPGSSPISPRGPGWTSRREIRLRTGCGCCPMSGPTSRSGWPASLPRWMRLQPCAPIWPAPMRWTGWSSGWRCRGQDSCTWCSTPSPGSISPRTGKTGRGASGGGGCPRHPGCPIGALRDGGGRCRPRRGADADALARWHAEAGGPL
ncbi:hypothetical protein AKL17_0896 [Frigidibacter mobilis]|uniref:DUF2332 domain-containing protein n=1 Tax=Frigidibacter mobilis TaxID=1335048 RepID=A0A159Z017_9RHOB|nr:hypothetical protein AKL17_0896 [Frigidibacter mobilis]